MVEIWLNTEKFVLRNENNNSKPRWLLAWLIIIINIVLITLYVRTWIFEICSFSFADIIFDRGVATEWLDVNNKAILTDSPPQLWKQTLLKTLKSDTDEPDTFLLIVSKLCLLTWRININNLNGNSLFHFATSTQYAEISSLKCNAFTSKYS